MNAVGVEARELRLRHKGEDLLRVNRFSCEPGETVVLLGANGAGKSLLLESLCGLQECRGDVSFYRNSGGSRQAVPRNDIVVGASLQRMGLWGTVRVGEILEIWEILSRHPRLRHPFLERILDRPYRHLSQGERQFLQFALVMGSGADLLVLDEPTMALDASLHSDVANTLRADKRTQILTTHSFDLLLGCADRSYFVARGRLVPLEVVRTRSLDRNAVVSAHPLRPDGSPDAAARILTRELEIDDPDGVGRINRELLFLLREASEDTEWRVVLEIPAFL